MSIFRLDKRILTLFSIVFVNLVGFGIIIPILPYYAKSLGASPIVIGLLFGTYSFFQFFSSPILGEFSDKIGRRPILLISIFGTAVSFLILGLANTILLLFISRALDGIVGGNISTAQAYIADITSKENRTYGMGIISASFGLGFIFGPAIGGLLAPFGYHVPALFAAFLAFVSFLLTYFFLPETIDKTKIVERKRRKLFDIADFKDTLTRPTVGSLISIYFFFFLAFSLLQGTFPLYASDALKLTASDVGYLFAYTGVISAGTQIFLLKRLTKIFKEKNLAVAGLIIMGLSFFIVPLSNNLLGLFIAFTFISFGNSIANPVITGIVSKLVPAYEQGNIMGVFQSVGSLGRLFGPIIGTIIYEFSITAPYYISAIMLLVGTYAVSNTLRKVKED